MFFLFFFHQSRSMRSCYILFIKNLGKQAFVKSKKIKFVLFLLHPVACCSIVHHMTPSVHQVVILSNSNFGSSRGVALQPDHIFDKHRWHTGLILIFLVGMQLLETFRCNIHALQYKLVGLMLIIFIIDFIVLSIT